MSELIYPGIVKNDSRVLVTEICEDVNVVNYRWYLPPEPGLNLDMLTEEYEGLCFSADLQRREQPRMWKFLHEKGLKLYLCPWCDN